MLEGITAGFIVSLTLFPGTVWLAKVGVAGRKRQVFAVGLAFALSQLVWMLVAVPGLMMMSAQLSFISGFMHWFAAFVLIYMAYRMFRTRRAVVLDDIRSLPSAGVLFRNGFNRALAMPMRLPIAMAVLLGTGVYVNNPASLDTVPSVLMGAVIGVFAWWGQITFLSAFFAKRVPYPITLKSLNKIRPFCGVLYLFLAALCLFFMN